MAIFFTGMLRHRRPDGEEKSDAPTYVSIVDLRCCNYYFHMFHSEYCIHGIHVVVEIFVSETLNELISFFVYFFNNASVYF